LVVGIVPGILYQFILLRFVPSPKKVSAITYVELTVRAYRVLVVICPDDIVFVETLLNVGSDISLLTVLAILHCGNYLNG
jgi:hypothetical protein